MVGVTCAASQSNACAILSVVVRRVWVMAALAVVEPETGSTDPLTRWLDDVLAQLGATVADAGEVSDAVRIDRIAALEQLRAVAAAAQQAEISRSPESQVDAHLAQSAGGSDAAVGRGIGDQIGVGLPDLPHPGPAAWAWPGR